MSSESTAYGAGSSASGATRFWNDPFYRGIIWQVVALAVVVLVGWYLVSTVRGNLEQQGIASGFGFLDREAGFAISESVIEYDASRTYERALFVGFLNTVRVAVIGIFLATILGTIVGVARLSRNWLVARIMSWYVEGVRNVPLLLQLFVWYALITESLPGPREALSLLPNVYLSNRGLMYPVPEAAAIYPYVGVALLLGVGAAVGVWVWARRRQDATGRQFPAFSAGLGLIIGLPLLVWLVGGAPTALDAPELGRFRFTGGSSLSPEFTALLLGLTLYTAGFIAEIVRSGILAVPHGQTEAAGALGLRRGVILRKVILPQALRVIVPPTTSQYLNLTKNSSLAVAIGYPDLVAAGNTTINQTGQAIEAISIYMAVYLLISLLISVFMNWYNKSIALVER